MRSMSPRGLCWKNPALSCPDLMRSDETQVLPSGEMTGVRYGTRENPWLSSEGDVIACTE